MWFHAMNAENPHSDKVEARCKARYPESFVSFKWYENALDAFYILELTNEIIISISGTKSKKAWVNDFLGWPGKMFHWGMHRAFNKLFKKPLAELKKTKKKVWITGHSRGGAMSVIALWWLRKVGCGTVEGIGYCGPAVCTERAIKAMKKLGCCFTRIFVVRGDIVDNSDPLCKHYGKEVSLYLEPDDHVVWEHAPSEVSKKLVNLMIAYNEIESATFVSIVMEIATK